MTPAKPRFRLSGEMMEAVKIDMRAFGIAIVRFDADGTQTLIDPMDVRLDLESAPTTAARGETA